MEFPSSSSAAARASMAEKSRRHLYGDADAQAALLLRHRLFPRAMAWNATQQQQQQVQQAQPQLQQQQQSHDWRRQRAEDEYQQLQPVQLQQRRDQYAESAVDPCHAVQSTSSQRQYMLQRQQQQHQHHQQQSVDVTGAFTAQLHAFHLNDQPFPPRPAEVADPMSEVPAQAVHEAMNFARSFPLLHATSVAENQLRRQQENVNHHNNLLNNTNASSNYANSNNTSTNSNNNPFLSGALPSQDAREKLFRTMGKWLDGGSAHNSAANSRSSFASSTGSTTTSASAMVEDGALLQHIPRKTNFDHVLPPPPPISISFASTAATSNASFGHAFSPVQSTNSFVSDMPSTSRNISSNSGLRRVNLVLQDPVLETPKAASFSGLPLPSYAESRGTPSPTNSNSNWSVASEPRMRSSPRDHSGSSSYGKKRHRATPAPSLAKALLTGCGAKRCSFEDCVKIAVSKGLCRGHGGGRRCQFTGCTKCAQSRSPYCWAHGGGKRCEAPNCRRSRKTKRYCVDHVEMEASVPLADSDESMDGPPSTVASDVDMTLTSIERSHSASDLQQQQSRQQQPSRRPTSAPKSAGTSAKLSLQLPSLNDALKRPFPSPEIFQQRAAVTMGVQRTQEERAFYQQQVQKCSFELPRSPDEERY